MIIAIDGPAASGKSTVAQALAERLGFGYLDTGAMYRAVALQALRTSTPLDDEEALSSLAEAAVIAFEEDSGGPPSGVLLDGEDVTQEIRTPEVNEAVSAVARVAGVRHAMVRHQRVIVGEEDYVVEGRDIGSVVFPDAELKIYLTASDAERARRRKGDLADAGHLIAHEDVAHGLGRRDELDSSRETSPLTIPEDAFVLDTTDFSIDQVVAGVLDLAKGI